MSTLQTDDPNIIDAEAVNWRLIVYPVLVVLVVGLGALGYYYYQQSTRDAAEADARAALLKATTPAEFLKVAEQYPNAPDQAMLAVFSAANASFAQRDYDGAQTAYRKIIDNPALGVQWHDSANLGIASCDEAKGDMDKALSEYLEVAHRGDASPFAPYAYTCVARIYEQRGDKTTELAILGQAAELDPGAPSTRRAIEQLKALTPQAPAMPIPVQATAPANLSPAAPAPATPAPSAK